MSAPRNDRHGRKVVSRLTFLPSHWISRCEVPTRPRPHRQAHSQVWAGEAGRWRPCLQSPTQACAQRCAESFRGAQVGLPRLPQGPPHPEAVSLEGLRPGGSPRESGPRLVQTQALGSGCLNLLCCLEWRWLQQERDMWPCPVKHAPPASSTEDTGLRGFGQ